MPLAHPWHIGAVPDLAGADATLAVIFGTSLLVGFSGAMSPGPVLALDIRESLKRGPWAGPAVALGHSAADLMMVLALGLGLSRFLSSDPAVIAIGVVGGAFLLWMASGMLRRPGQGAPLPAAGGAGTPRQPLGLSPVVHGALVSLSNPFFSVWWGTIGLAYLVWARDTGGVGMGAFFVGHIASDFIWFSAVAVAVGTGRRLMTDAVYRGVFIVCGLFLAGMGVFFLVRGVGTAWG